MQMQLNNFVFVTALKERIDQQNWSRFNILFEVKMLRTKENWFNLLNE